MPELERAALVGALFALLSACAGSPATPVPSPAGERASAAERCLAETDPAAASACLEAFVESYTTRDPPGAAAAVFTLHGQAREEAGELEAARQSYRRALDLERVAGREDVEREAFLLLRLGRVESELGGLLSARSLLARAAALEPASADTRFAIAAARCLVFERRKETDLAHAELDVAIALAPESSAGAAAELLPVAWRLLGDDPDALAGAIEGLARAELRAPSDAWEFARALGLLMGQLLFAERSEEALREAERGLLFAAEANDESGAMRFGFEAGRLDAFYALGPPERALGACTELLDEKRSGRLPGRLLFHAFDRCVTVAAEAGEAEPRRAWLERGVALGANRPDAPDLEVGRLMFLLAELGWEERQTEVEPLLLAAVSRLEAAKAEPRMRAIAYLRAAKLALARGESEDAIQRAGSAVNTFAGLPDPPPEALAEAGEVWSIELLRSGKVVHAEAAARRTMGLLGSPTSETALAHARLGFVVSRAERRQSRYNAAIESAQQALAQIDVAADKDASFQGVVHHHLGSVYVLIGDHARAVGHYQTALRRLQGLRAKSDLAYVFATIIGLAGVLEKEGDVAQALDLYERVLLTLQSQGQIDPVYYVVLKRVTQLNLDQKRYTRAYEQARLLARLIQTQPDSDRKVTETSQVQQLLRRIASDARQAEIERQDELNRAARPPPP